MKLSFNLLKELLPIDLNPSEVAAILTEIGLETEGIEHYVSHKGLENVVVGEVIEKQKHPNADKLSLTKVHIGNDNVLSIVCGAPNVEKGQKVLVALPGAKLHTFSGEIIEIKKSKIRGEASEGMICAADELGISNDHAGIMVLPPDVPAGTSATEYFKVEHDDILEIAITANRGDAVSHIGVARDLKAYLKTHFDKYTDLNIHFPATLDFPEPSGTINIDIEIKNTEDCRRYAGIVINGVKVAPSPQWLQNKLSAVGIRPINNIVDITNYVMIELGQPLHAFDVRAIKGNKIIVQNVKEGTEFVTLDGVTRKLSAYDLMICNAEEPVCIAGIFGGLHSGIKEDTQTIFIESAWFNPSAIRRTATRLGLKTDASFRFERHADPDMVIFALNRAYTLIQEIAGGNLSMGVKDNYPQPFEPHKVGYSIRHANDLFGQEIPFDITKKIIQELDIQIESESHEGMLLLVPPRKSDVTREVDVAEEILRIYGYNKIQPKKFVRYQIPEHKRYDHTQWTKFIQKLSDYLADKGFYETQSLSFHNNGFYSETAQQHLIKIKNPVNTELNTLRQTLLFNALQTISLNERHQQKNLLGFEIGKIYYQQAQLLKEEYCLSLFSFGKNKTAESFYSESKEFYFIKELTEKIFSFCNTEYSAKENQKEGFIQSLSFYHQNKEIAYIGFVHPDNLKKFEIETQPVIFAEINLEYIFNQYKHKKTEYREIPKFPVVERDLSLLLDKNISYAQIKKIVQQVAKSHLKDLTMFDYYQGKNIPENKKSYAIRLHLQDVSKTLTDKEIDSVMNKIIHELKTQLNAELR